MPSIAAEEAESRPVRETMKAFARTRIRELLQALLIQEVEGLIGRAKSERRAPGTSPVYRDGFGKERKPGTWHRFATGDFELALRGPPGDGAGCRAGR
jgi:hypothetical protein